MQAPTYISTQRTWTPFSFFLLFSFPLLSLSLSLSLAPQQQQQHHKTKSKDRSCQRGGWRKSKACRSHHHPSWARGHRHHHHHHIAIQLFFFFVAFMLYSILPPSPPGPAQLTALSIILLGLVSIVAKFLPPLFLLLPSPFLLGFGLVYRSLSVSLSTD